MSTEFSALNRARVTLENADELSASDLSELCDATEEAIKSGGGFGWLNAPPRNILEDYWRGVLLIPERSLIVGKVDMVIAGSCQIVRPPKANEAQAFACQLTTFFLAPWARGYGLAQKLVDEPLILQKVRVFQSLIWMSAPHKSARSIHLKLVDLNDLVKTPITHSSMVSM